MNRAILTGLSVVMLFFASCKNDDELPVLISEYPIVELARPLAIADTVLDNPQRIEFGYEFTPKVDGTFNSITGIMPVSGSYQVTLWDQFTQSSIGRWTVSFVEYQYNEVFVEVPVELVASKTYLLTVNTKDWIIFQPPVSEKIFPQTQGNIEITRFATRITFQPAFPDTYYDNVLYGLIDFQFRPIPNP